MLDVHSDLAALVYGEGQDPDSLLRAFAGDLKGAGARVAGLVQSGHRNRAPQLSATLLHTGTTIALFQDLGPDATGCRLDVGQVVSAGASISAAVDAGADLVILNRFGKLEREGRGLAYLIEKALFAHVPVVLAVAENYVGDWAAFSGGMGVQLPCDRAALDAWWQAAQAKRAA
jgi:hypothetical protein